MSSAVSPQAAETDGQSATIAIMPSTKKKKKTTAAHHPVKPKPHPKPKPKPRPKVPGSHAITFQKPSKTHPPPFAAYPYPLPPPPYGYMPGPPPGFNNNNSNEYTSVLKSFMPCCCCLVVSIGIVILVLWGLSSVFCNLPLIGTLFCSSGSSGSGGIVGGALDGVIGIGGSVINTGSGLIGGAVDGIGGLF